MRSSVAKTKKETQEVSELYTEPTFRVEKDWKIVLLQEHCQYIGKRCAKRRKTEPGVSIGTCSVNYGVKNPKVVIICPFRFLERKQVFTDCIHLLTHKEPGDELHVVSEVAIPGGNVDYCLIAVRRGKVVDFVGIELQAVDTTGTVWPTRQRFLSSLGLAEETGEDSGFGMNWKMSAKTILVQLHHKVETFEHVGRYFVLVVQDHFMNEMIKSFSFAHVGEAKLGNHMHFHAYSLNQTATDYRLELAQRKSTDSQGVQTLLGNASEAKIELQAIFDILQEKINKSLVPTLLTMQTVATFRAENEETIPNKTGLLED
jgi:hypothetical protein